MTIDVRTTEASATEASRSSWARRVFSTDHKVIGIQFLFYSLGFLVLGGLLSLVIRWQLA